MKRKVYTLFDSRSNCGLEYQDYVDFCEVNEIEPQGDNSHDYYEWLGDTSSMYINDFLSDLAYVHDDMPVIVQGSLGLWNGHRSIYPMLFESTDYTSRNGKCVPNNPALKRAIEKCISNMDDFKVELNNGDIIVYGYHHDGTNTFTINKVSKKGQPYVLNAFEKGRPTEVKGFWLAKFRMTDLD